MNSLNMPEQIQAKSEMRKNNKQQDNLMMNKEKPQTI